MSTYVSLQTEMCAPPAPSQCEWSLDSGNALTHSIKVRHHSSPDRIIINISFGSFPEGTAVQAVLSSAGHAELCELFKDVEMSQSSRKAAVLSLNLMQSILMQ